MHGKLTSDTRTDTQTNRHVDSMTDPAQRAKSVKNIQKTLNLVTPVDSNNDIKKIKGKKINNKSQFPCLYGTCQ